MVKQLSLREIVQQCQAEAQQVREEEVGYCFELFRRALDEKDGLAWEAVYNQYNMLVVKWLQACAKEVLSVVEVEDLSQDALTRFWRVGQKRSPLSDYFEHVGALLNYFKRCTVSTFFEYQRKRQRQTNHQRLMDVSDNLDLANMPDPADSYEGEERLRTLRATFEKMVVTKDDPDEVMLFKLLFEQGLSAAQIVEQHPQRFPSNYDVYRIKERLVRRARRTLYHSQSQI